METILNSKGSPWGREWDVLYIGCESPEEWGRVGFGQQGYFCVLRCGAQKRHRDCDITQTP